MSAMYHVKPLNDIANPVQSTDVMYSMPRLQNTTLNVTEVSVELLELRQRQDQLLQLLDRINTELLSVENVSHLDNADGIAVVLWKTHLHSSLRHPLDQDLYLFNDLVVDRGNYELIITVIYTSDVDDVVAIVNPSSTIPVVGESDIARMFGRLMGVYDCRGQNPQLTATCDICLDACSILTSSATTPKGKQVAVNTLDRILQIGRYFCGDSPNFVDAVVESALTRSGIKIQSSSLRRWMIDR